MSVSNSDAAWLISPFAKSAMTWLISLITCVTRARRSVRRA